MWQFLSGVQATVFFDVGLHTIGTVPSVAKNNIKWIPHHYHLGFSHHYHLGESTVILMGITSDFKNLCFIPLFNEFSLSKPNSPAFCGVISGTMLFAYAP